MIVRPPVHPVLAATIAVHAPASSPARHFDHAITYASSGDFGSTASPFTAASASAFLNCLSSVYDHHVLKYGASLSFGDFASSAPHALSAAGQSSKYISKLARNRSETSSTLFSPTAVTVSRSTLR